MIDRTTGLLLLALAIASAIKLVLHAKDERELRHIRHDLRLTTQMLRLWALEWGTDPEALRHKLIAMLRDNDLPASRRAPAPPLAPAGPDPGREVREGGRAPRVRRARRRTS